MIAYKIDILNKLKENGWNTTRLLKELPIGQQTIQNIRKGKPISFKALDTICKLTNLQPGDIIEYVEE